MTERITEKQAIAMLRKAFGKNRKRFRKVLAHSRAVQKQALRIAKKLARKGNQNQIDIEFVKTSSLLHDIGRSRCLPGTKDSIRHGVIGARILRSYRLPRHAKVAERHIGAGITQNNAKKYGLPPGSYMPKTIEEKIVAHADNLIDLDKPKPFAHIYRRYEKKLGKEYAMRLLKLKKQVDP